MKKLVAGIVAVAAVIGLSACQPGPGSVYVGTNTSGEFALVHAGAINCGGLPAFAHIEVSANGQTVRGDTQQVCTNDGRPTFRQMGVAVAGARIVVYYDRPVTPSWTFLRTGSGRQVPY